MMQDKDDLVLNTGLLALQQTSIVCSDHKLFRETIKRQNLCV